MATKRYYVRMCHFPAEIGVMLCLEVAGATKDKRSSTSESELPPPTPADADHSVDVDVGERLGWPPGLPGGTLWADALHALLSRRQRRRRCMNMRGVGVAHLHPSYTVAKDRHHPSCGQMPSLAATTAFVSFSVFSIFHPREIIPTMYT